MNTSTSSEHMVAIVSFDGAVKREVARVRAKLQPAAEKGVLSGNEFSFTIKASGRILDGEMKLEFSISGVYGTAEVKGNSTNAVVDEFLRRQGWAAVNQPLAISASEEISF